jgi:hypothetical protein
MRPILRVVSTLKPVILDRNLRLEPLWVDALELASHELPGGAI